MLALWNIVYLHKIPLIGATTGLPGVFYGPWWYYMLSPFFLIFSGNPQGIAFVMALVGISTIIMGFVLGKRIGGIFLGLILALFLGISHDMISLSSQIWNPNITPLFVIFVLLILQKIYSSNKKETIAFFFLGILLALNIDLEIIFGSLFSIGIILSVPLVLRGKINFKEILAFIVGILVIFSPRIFFELRHGFLMTKSLLAFFVHSPLSQSVSSSSTILNKLGTMLNQFNATLAFDNMILGILFLVFISASLVFLYKKAEKQIKNFIRTSMTVILVFIFGTAFLNHDVWPHYLVSVPVFYILLFAISLNLIRKNMSKNIFYFFSIFFILIFLFVDLVPIVRGNLKPLWEGDASVYRNQVAVIDYVYDNAQGKDFKYVVYTPPVHDYTYQYLFMWYGQKMYHYTPKTQANLAFFILEPDMQYPSRLKDWLVQRAGDGKIIKSQTVKGGIIVQTRIH